jgi:hypothetical protein
VNGEFFGAGVAIDGDTAAVGLGFGTSAPLIMGPGPTCALAHESCSNVFVYQHVAGTANWQLVSTLTTAGFDDPSQPFGGLTALDGGRLISGAYVFQNATPGVWRPYEELQPHPPVPTCANCNFGRSVGVSGRTEIANGGGENSAVYP